MPVTPALARAHERAAAASLLERESLTAIEAAALAAARSRALARTFAVGAVCSLPGLVSAFVVTELGSRLVGELVVALHLVVMASAAVAGLAALGVAAYSFRPGSIPAVAAGLRSQMLARAAERGAAGRCPSCGANVVAPAPVALFDCGHCRAPIALAHGVVIAWADSVSVRARSWRERARDVHLAADLWPWRMWLAFTVLLVTLSSGVWSLGELMTGAGR